MKKLFILLCFMSLSSFAQTTYFFDKKGKKTVMRDDTVEIIVTDERLTYAENGKDWEKYIKFKDIDYAIIGPYLFKSYKLKNKKGNSEKETAYFVIAETAERKLLCYTYTIVGKGVNMSHYNIFFVDKDDNILDFIKFNTSNIYIGARGKITPYMNKYFSDCPSVMEKFAQFPDNDDKHLDVLEFFDKPYYLKCN